MAKTLFNNQDELLTPKSAALWASSYLGKEVTSNNIMYLINYGKIANHTTKPKENLINQTELKAYYDKLLEQQPLSHPLSFANYKETQTTKHVHRLHPYKGKFIPQLVEYFLDNHTDSLKHMSYFKEGDIILDPFCGSGTTLCVANELNMHAIGIDISVFNAMLTNAKIMQYDLHALQEETERLSNILELFYMQSSTIPFENALNQALNEFNTLYFPSKEFKRRVVLKEIDEKVYGKQKEKEFLKIYNDLAKQFDIQLKLNAEENFFEKWYIDSVRQEILIIKNEIDKSPQSLQNILKIILSRTARSCRATTHADLATLKTPITTSYYCAKHGRICKPLFSIIKWWKQYTKDTIKRLKEFNDLRSDSLQLCLNANSANVNVHDEIARHNAKFAKLLESQKIAGIFSSPPYVGLIDYHEQHAYSYDILNLERNDVLEIGKKRDGQGKIAQEKYIQGIASVLCNAKRFLKKDYDIFLVANDKFNLYPKIAELAGMRIVNRFDRPVINRSEKNKNLYSESIFHLKKQK